MFQQLAAHEQQVQGKLQPWPGALPLTPIIEPASAEWNTVAWLRPDSWARVLPRPWLVASSGSG